MAGEYLEMSLGQLLDRVAAREPAPAGGSAAAVAVAMAAGLVAMVARFSSEQWSEAPGTIAQAETLRARAAPLAQEDAEAYEGVLAAMRLPREGASEDRDRELGRRLERAAAVPLEIAAIASDVAVLAAEAAERGNQNLRGDAAAAAVLAEAGARVGANLVSVNLGATEDDERVVAANAYVETASAAARRALAPGG